MKNKIGTRIRYYRVISGMSQENLADEIGMTHGNYGKIERGEIDVNTTTLSEIARVLNVSISQFFGESEFRAMEESSPYSPLNREDVHSLILAVQELSAQINQLPKTVNLKKTGRRNKHRLY